MVKPADNWRGRCGASALFVILIVLASHAANAQVSDQYRSETEIRLMQLENRFREVTGQYEEAMYRLTQMNRQLENSLADMDFRLQQLEAGNLSATVTGEEGSPVVDAVSTTESSGEPPFELDLSEEPAEMGVDPLLPETNPDQYLVGTTPEEQFDAAFTLVRRDKLDEAVLAFRAFLAKYPDHASRANATYWLGKSYFAQSKFTDAAKVFVEGVSAYGRSNKGADMLLHLGLSLNALGQQDEACSAFREVDLRYPNANSSVMQRKHEGQLAAGCV